MNRYSVTKSKNQEDDFKSLYEDDRRKEFETMEVERLIKKCWDTVCDRLPKDQMRLEVLADIESTLIEGIRKDYGATNFKLDRITKIISFEIDCEEINL